jgi:putative membrane protein insertion efficiency factor
MGSRQGRRAGLIIAAMVIAALAIHDMAAPTSRAFGARAALSAIESYQAHVSPHLRGVVVCRFQPTCSHYGHEAIRKYGLAVGGWKTAKRIARCGAWTKMGTVDEP